MKLNIIGFLLIFFLFYNTFLLILKILVPKDSNEIITYLCVCVFQNNIPKLSLAVRLLNAILHFFVVLFVLIYFNLSCRII